ncbi:hypothetical protein GCM10011374_03380 [Kocuria dechangensis]|uniref:Uncharacterized protein n=1 Tax=Kocuria dechangensis TaxID=1176249 RepID=A0A917LMH5_9MICC|nr:hypothetical protein [Kocuria dechangensis]GGG44406.1 hypothetical protein GCM10011374_03380 [Kocuria dechangensis]
MVRIIRTPEQLEALPDHAVVVDATDRIRECWTVQGERRWFKPGDDAWTAVVLPAVLLHVREP